MRPKFLAIFRASMRLAFRAMARHRGYTLTSIFGLSAGLAKGRNLLPPSGRP
jgi:hypothetical protein